MNSAGKALQDPRIYTANNPKSNILLDAAGKQQQQLLLASLAQAIQSGQEKLISVALNLAPSYPVAEFISTSLSKLFQGSGFKSYIFVIPVLIVSARSGEPEEHAVLPVAFARATQQHLLQLLENYGAFYLYPTLLQNLSQISMAQAYQLQQEIQPGLENQEQYYSLIKNAMLGSDLAKQADTGFNHQTSSSSLQMCYLIGLSANNMMFDPEVFARLGMNLMQALAQPSDLAQESSLAQIYIPCCIAPIVQAVNEARFFFIESIFNIEVSDTVKSLRMDNDSTCYARIATSNNGHESYIILQLYRRPLALLPQSVKSNIDILVKELFWPLTIVDDFSRISNRITGLLTAVQVSVL